MIIQGRFVGGAPYFAVHLRTVHFHSTVWLLADTGASRTTLMDRDVQLLAIPHAALTSAGHSIVGVGGSVRSFQIHQVELRLTADTGSLTLQQDLWVVQHDLQAVSQQEAARILRLPTVMGRGLINQFRFTCDLQARIVELSRP